MDMDTLIKPVRIGPSGYVDGSDSGSVQSVRVADVSGDMGPLYSFSDSQFGNADGDGRASVR